MENKPYIKVGGRIFAVAHIAAMSIHGGIVELWIDGDPDSWEFRGEDAKALAKWTKGLPCEDLLPDLQPANEQ